MIDRVKIFFARLFCLHEWEKNISTRKAVAGMAVYGRGILKAFVCKRCLKEVLRFEEPISYQN